jgi:hypothetical protein
MRLDGAEEPWIKGAYSESVFTREDDAIIQEECANEADSERSFLADV